MLFDTHCHLLSPELHSLKEKLLENAWMQGLHGICVITTHSADMALCREIASWKKPSPEFILIHSAGLHPHEARGFNAELEKQIRNLSQRAHAIGETGLDFHYNFSDEAIQKESFRFHVALAEETQKPLVIHSREAHKVIVDILSSARVQQRELPGILHCFTGNWTEAQELLDLGLYLSFSGILTFKNSTDIQEVARKVPLNRMLIETDAPYLSPMPLRGKQNEPAHVIHTLQYLSTLRNESISDLKQALWKNSLDIFRLH